MSKTEKPKAGLKPTSKKVVKRKPKRGRPLIKFSPEQKKLAVEYVEMSGLWKVRLSKFLKVDYETLDRILKKDKNFSNDLEAAEAKFIGKKIDTAKPEFVLRTKYREEFPDNSFSNDGTGGNEEIDAVILRIRKILPSSGQ